MKTAIINFNAGNLFSVMRACEQAGLNPFIASHPADLNDSHLLLMPGVGAYQTAMDVLKQKGFDEAIIQDVQKGKPFVGICLGMQLMLSSSEEFGNTLGLNFIPGVVKSLRSKLGLRVRVPHVGWKKIKLQSPSFFAREFDDQYMYFLHSFYADPKNNLHIMAKTTYEGFEFSSVIQKDNVLGIQFHPERSGPLGLKMYETFKNWYRSL
jgi:glutamine amidotransferase